MRPLLECVPNFSEGSDAATLDAIAAAIRRVPGVHLLEVDAGGASTNRTVMTLAGPPEAVVEAAYQAIATAAQRIDMRRHTGEHPRMGATDVCPLIPISGISTDEAVALARRLAERVGALGIPAYLYEYAATAPHRRSLADLRAGEYEGFFEKIKQPEWRPDFGPAEMNPTAGATVIGVRDFLVAYNVNLNTTSVRRANSVAFDVREAGRTQLGPDGKPARDAAGEPIRVPGRLKHVRAIGWYLDDYGIAQVSMNLTNIAATPLHTVFEAVEDCARARGLRVTGSELVGLIPKACLVEAGAYFLRRQQRSDGLSERELIDLAVRTLGLGELRPFEPEKKILEYALEALAAEPRLMRLPIDRFTEQLAGEQPAPGGGTVAALCGGLAAALGAMVANLSAAKKGWEEKLEHFAQIARALQHTRALLLDLADRDTQAFNAVMAAFALPKGSPARAEAIVTATLEAARVPLSVMQAAATALPHLQTLAREGLPTALSDVGVGARCLDACLEGAALNVRINLASLPDPSRGRDLRDELTRLLSQTRGALQQLYLDIDQKIG